MFSKACEYGIRAALYIASIAKDGGRVSLIDVAREIGSPEAFTAKILQELVRNEIISSVKGPNGGFFMEPKRKIKLSQIVYAIDGDSIYKGCGLGLPECSEKMPCPVHEKFKEIRNGLRKMLESTTLEELSKGINSGATFLKQ